MVNQPGECKIVTFTIHDNPVGKKRTKISLELIGKERIKEALGTTPESKGHGRLYKDNGAGRHPGRKRQGYRFYR